MRFASLALAALLLVPAAAAQQATSLTPGPRHDGPLQPPTNGLSAAVQVTQNSSLDITRGTVACAAQDSEGGSLGSTTNSFWRVIDLAGFTLPTDAVLSGANFGVSVSLLGADGVEGQLKVHTLPPGTNVANGFNLADLTEIASTDLAYGSADVRQVLELVSATFDVPPSLAGTELLAVELTFPDGTAPEGGEAQFDARAGGNAEAADGVSYLSTPDCGGIGPTPFRALGATFTTEFVVVLLVDEPGAATAIGSARDAGSGATVTVEGVVSRAKGAFTYLQDATGGLVIRQTSGDFFDQVAAGTIQPGTSLRVTGTLSEFNSLLQISSSALTSFEVLGTTDVPTPQVVTLTELATNGEAYEGELVTISDVTLATADASFRAAETYAIADASDATNAVGLRIPNAGDSDIDGTAIPGNPIAITGPVGQFSSLDPAAGYQVFGINDGDITGGPVALGESPDGRLGLSAPTPNPSAQSATVTVSMATAGPATLAVYDVLGREVARVLDGPLAAGATPVRIDVGGLPAGTYLVRLSADGVAAVRPLTVVR